MRFTQSWLAVGALIIALILPGISRASSSLEERVARLEQVFENQINTELINKVEAIQQENHDLRGTLELQEYKIKQLSIRQEQLYYTNNNKDINVAIEKNLSKIEEINTNDIAQAISTNSENSAYNKAYELIDRKNYLAAETAFKDFLWQHPDSKYAANAHYWLGEVYLAEWQKNKESQLLLEQATASFKIVIENYTHHHKAVDSMLKLGILESERGNWQAAKLYLEKLKNTYPDSSRVRMADAKLQELKQRGHI